MHNTNSPLLPPGPFTRRQAEAIVATYQNVATEDDQGTDFRLVIRRREGQLLWRAWNFDWPVLGNGSTAIWPVTAYPGTDSPGPSAEYPLHD